MKSVVLTGFMGVGKSTIGQRVAALFNLPFIDLDRRIEAAAGLSVAALFDEGEATFRGWEQQTLATLERDTPMVLATGGGALIGARNRQWVADATVIVLDAPLDTIQTRLAQEGGRPLAAQSKALYERRRAIYEQFPFHINTDGLGVDAVVAKVVELVEAEREKGETTLPSQAGENHPLNPAVELSIINYQLSMNSAAAIGERVAALNPTGAAIITDETIGRLWGEQVRHDLLAAKIPTTLIEVPAGEAHKTLATMSFIYDRLLAAGIDRGGAIVALGGGVVGDIAGFAAATWMRGVRVLVQMPTTLLAMVDASIGGKTGIDHPQGKNLIGAFRAADMILAEPTFLTSLPVREWRSGLAEVIKHGIIADPILFAMMSDSPPTEPPSLKTEAERRFLLEWLGRAIRVKSDIVARDPYEQGERAKLNLGHTFGHAYETLSGFALAHGEAVAIGIVTAARLSEMVGVAHNGVAAEIMRVLEGVGLPTAWREAPDAETIWQAMQSDKKKAGKGLRLILPRAIGDVIVTAPGEIAKADVMRVLGGKG